MSSIAAITYAGSVAVTASDTTDDPKGVFAGLLVTVTGNVTFIDEIGGTNALAAVAANTIINIACKRVNSTGLTATVRGLLAFPYKPPTV